MCGMPQRGGRGVRSWVLAGFIFHNPPHQGGLLEQAAQCAVCVNFIGRLDYTLLLLLITRQHIIPSALPAMTQCKIPSVLCNTKDKKSLM